MNDTVCRKWAEGDHVMEEYHDHEWCRIHHDDTFEFEMLSLEGASVGLSWSIILHRRDAYRRAYHNFDIEYCASMKDEELEGLISGSELIRNRSKIYSVRKNARAVKKIQNEFGSFDAYLWHFTDGRQIDEHWQTPDQVPSETELSALISKDMKKRGMSYVGPVITYSFMQAVGIVNDHLADCPYR